MRGRAVPKLPPDDLPDVNDVPIAIKHCGGCRYYQPMQPDVPCEPPAEGEEEPEAEPGQRYWGECRYGPPSNIIAEDGVIPHWPVVPSIEWCGCHVPRVPVE